MASGALFSFKWYHCLDNDLFDKKFWRAMVDITPEESIEESAYRTLLMHAIKDALMYLEVADADFPELSEGQFSSVAGRVRSFLLRVQDSGAAKGRIMSDTSTRIIRFFTELNERFSSEADDES